MVVPIERLGRSEKLKKYVGNNLILNMANNKITLAVIGNNCKINIEENSGFIKVVGDNCDITVIKGSANIDYVGNCGRIRLGVNVSENTVNYIGNEGEISSTGQTVDFDAEKTTETRTVRNHSPHIVNITNYSNLRVANACIPNAINISIPTIRFSRRGQQLGRHT